MNELVECYAGHAYPDRPRSLYWQGRYRPVDTVISRARLPEGLWFRVSTDEGEIFDLTYSVVTGVWRIQMFSSA
jgi:hypothetical protein